MTRHSKFIIGLAIIAYLLIEIFRQLSPVTSSHPSTRLPSQSISKTSPKADKHISTPSLQKKAPPSRSEKVLTPPRPLFLLPPNSMELKIPPLVPSVSTKEYAGPQRPKPSLSTEPSSIPTLISPSNGKDLEFDYGYHGKEKDNDKHDVSIGVQKDGVSVKTNMKASPEGTDVQSIDIQIELPK